MYGAAGPVQSTYAVCKCDWGAEAQNSDELNVSHSWVKRAYPNTLRRIDRSDRAFGQEKSGVFLTIPLHIV